MTHSLLVFKLKHKLALKILMPFVLYPASVRDSQTNQWLSKCSSQELSTDCIVDMIFIGPNDLALSVLGYVPAMGDEPSLISAIENIVAAARKHGKWVGRLSNDGASCKEHLKFFDTVAMSYDIRAIQNWYTSELQIARS